MIGAFTPRTRTAPGLPVMDAPDQIRSYSKCTRRGPGGATVGIWFDDHRDDQTRLRSYKMVARNPAQLVNRFTAWAATVPSPG